MCGLILEIELKYKKKQQRRRTANYKRYNTLPYSVLVTVLLCPYIVP